MSEEQDKPIDATSPEPTVAELQAELEKAKKEHLYHRADFDNYRKQVLKERSEYMKYGGERIFTELLEVIDNFDRALSFEVKPENLDSMVKGVKLIRDELKTLLSRFQVQEIPAQGEKFDPNIHSALGTEPTDKVPPGHITQVLKKPYKLHDRVIRPGQVVIAAEPKKEG